jgi:hypothetical protein
VAATRSPRRHAGAAEGPSEACEISGLRIGNPFIILSDCRGGGVIGSLAEWESRSTSCSDPRR